MPPNRKRSFAVPELRCLHIFHAIQQAGSFKAAALRLGVTVSAVSQSMQILEATLEHELFDRSQRPMTLTPFGQKYCAIAAEFLEASRKYGLACDELHQDRQREIRMGCVDSFAATVGPALVKSMTGHSGNVVMLTGITPQILTHLARHDIDMAICTEAPDSQPKLYVEAICEESWVVVSPADRQWPEQLSFSHLRQLAHDLPIVRYTRRSNIGALIDQLLSHIGVDSPRRFEFDTTDSLLSLVAGGVGWAVTSPLCLLQSEHHARRVTISRLPKSAHQGRRFYILSRENVSRKAMAEMANLIRQIMGTQMHKQMKAVNAALKPELLTVA